MAIQAAEVLGDKLNVVVENMEAFTPDAPHLQEASLVLVCTSTYGSGAPPPTATKYPPHRSSAVCLCIDLFLIGLLYQATPMIASIDNQSCWG